MSIIWIFREQRSGSTALTGLISERLNRTDRFVQYSEDNIESVKNISNPEDYIFSTHDYNFIEIMDSYDQPITLIRCARKDRVERCISYLIAKYKTLMKHQSKFDPWNLLRSENPSEYRNFLAGIEPTVFTKKEIYNYLDCCIERDRYWNLYASSYQNYTVFYEDLCTEVGVDVPALGLTSLSIINGDARTVKQPADYKRQICLNYDMVVRWINEYYSENRL